MTFKIINTLTLEEMPILCGTHEIALKVSLALAQLEGQLFFVQEKRPALAKLAS